MKWTDNDVQHVFDPFHGLWRDSPAPEEWENFLELVNGKIAAKFVAAAIRRVKSNQTDRNFRPATGVFLAELSSDMPGPSTEVPALPDQVHDPHDLLHATLEAAKPEDAWLCEIVKKSRRERQRA